jgi:hypothetical protein
MWEVVFHVRERDVGERKDRAQNIGFSQAVEKVWKGQGCMGGSVLQQEGGFWKRIIGKATVSTPGNNIYTRIQCDTIGVGSELPDTCSIIISYKGHFDRKPGVLTG